MRVVPRKVKICRLSSHMWMKGVFYTFFDSITGSDTLILTVDALKEYSAEKPLYALIGYPLGHSMSRFIHTWLFEQDNANAEYVLVETKPAELSQCVSLLKEKAEGFNITIPYKQDIIKYLDCLEENSRIFGAVNTVHVKDGRLFGYNTDYQGFEASLLRAEIGLYNKKVLLLGAGGVARMIAFKAAKTGAELTIAARRIRQAQKLAADVKEVYTKAVIDVITLDRAKNGYDVIINATPVGMSPNTGTPVKSDVLFGASSVYDTIYNPLKTPLLKTAEGLGAKVENGLYMLISQAAAAQSIWTGRKFPKTALERITTKAAAYLTIYPKNIVLTGFMGCGKTSIGKVLSDRLGYKFLDMDFEIEKEAGKSISEIFETDGESIFRSLEHELSSALKDCTKTVISTGGGVMLNDENVKALKANGIIIYLNVDKDNLFKRLEQDKSRPLLSAQDRRAGLNSLYKKRLPVYQKHAHITIDANCDINTVADNIIEYLLKGDLYDSSN